MRLLAASNAVLHFPTRNLGLKRLVDPLWVNLNERPVSPIQRVRPGVLNRLLSNDAAARTGGADMFAAMIVDGPLARFEVLADTPLPPTEIEGITVVGRAPETNPVE